MLGSTAWVTASTPRRLTPSTKSHSSSSVLTKKAKRSVPALLTSTSIGAELLDRRSHGVARRPGVGDVERRRRSRRSHSPPQRAACASRSPMPTRAPSAARRRAVAAPIPEAPPVTSAVLPSSLTRRSLYSAAVPAPPTDPVAMIGASGALGFGLAVRLARTGVPIAIGSRDAGPGGGDGTAGARGRARGLLHRPRQRRSGRARRGS